MVSTRRQYNFELLRIISMLMIISLHFWGHCLKIKEIEADSLLFYVGWLFETVSLVSVNIYVLLSAYFLCDRKFKFEKLTKLLVEVFFYSVVIYWLSGGYVINKGGYIRIFLPCISGEYWFATCYVCLYILSPFLNTAIKNLKEQQHRLLMIILLSFFVIIPNVFSYSRWLTFGGGGGIVWFITLYVVGAYIKKHIDFDRLTKHKKTLGLVTLGLLILPYCVKILITIVSQRVFTRNISLDTWFQYNSILIFIATVSLFLYFTTIKIKNDRLGKVVLFLSRSTFAVYLIHDNNWVRTQMWDYVRPFLHIDSFYIVIQFVFIVTLVFIICTLLDQVRFYLFRWFDRIGVFTKMSYLLKLITNKMIE